MMERMPSSQDRFVKSLGSKIEKNEEARETKEMLTDRLVERVGEIVRGIQRNEADFKRANSFAEKMAVTTHMFELEAELDRLRSIYDRVLVPTQNELMHGSEPLSEDEEILIEKEVPLLLVGGKKPIPLEKRKTRSEETVYTGPESGLFPREGLGEVPLYRSDEASVPNMQRPPSLELDDMPVLRKEKTPSKPRLMPGSSGEISMLESIDRQARALPESKRLAFFIGKREQILDSLASALAESPEDEAGHETRISRLEERFHAIQNRVNQWRKAHEEKTRPHDIGEEKTQKRDLTDIDHAA